MQFGPTTCAEAISCHVHQAGDSQWYSADNLEDSMKHETKAYHAAANVKLISSGIEPLDYPDHDLFLVTHYEDTTFSIWHQRLESSSKPDAAYLSSPRPTIFSSTIDFTAKHYAIASSTRTNSASIPTFDTLYEQIDLIEATEELGQETVCQSSEMTIDPFPKIGFWFDQTFRDFPSQIEDADCGIIDGSDSLKHKASSDTGPSPPDVVENQRPTLASEYVLNSGPHHSDVEISSFVNNSGRSSQAE